MRSYKRYSEVEKKQLLDLFELSGSNINEFARQNGIGESTFFGWVKAAKKKGKTRISAGFVPVKISLQEKKRVLQRVRLHLPGGAFLEVETNSPAEFCISLVRAWA